MRWLYLRTAVAFLQSCEEAIALGHLDIPDYFPRREGGLPLHYDASFKMSLRNFWSTFLLPGKEAQIWNGKQIFAPFHLTGHLTLCSCVHCQNWKCFHENIYFLFKPLTNYFFLNVGRESHITPELITHILSIMGQIACQLSELQTLETLKIVQFTRGSIYLHMPRIHP